jgi:protease I
MPDMNMKGLRVAVLATDGFEHSELLKPRDALRDAGAEIEIVSPKRGNIRAWVNHDWGEEIAVDRTLADADPADYDALVLPGGVINADQLRMDPAAVEFVKAMVEAGKPVGVICHGAWTLIEAGAIRGHRMTSWPSLKSDLENAGAHWVDEEVVVDGWMVSSRKPDDLPAFNREITRLFAAQSRDSARPRPHAQRRSNAHTH